MSGWEEKHPMQRPASLRPHQSTLIAAAILSIILWVTPFFGFVLLPLQYLNTYLHECSHATAAMLTGGPVEYVNVFRDGSGLTLASGSPVLVSSAGYIGATFIGALMIWFGRTARGASTTLRIIAGVLVFSLVFWVRGDAIGVTAGFAWIGVLFAIPHWLNPRQTVFMAQFLGMQQCLASIQSLYILLRISAFPGLQSDAANLAEYTGVPALVWALLWSLIGFSAVYVTLRASWSRHPAE